MSPEPTPTSPITRPQYLVPQVFSERLPGLPVQGIVNQSLGEIVRVLWAHATDDVNPAGGERNGRIEPPEGREGEPRERRPIDKWLRSFFSLRWQFTSVFIALQSLLLFILGGLMYGFVATFFGPAHAMSNTLWTTMVLITIAVVVIGGVVAFFFAGILLRPLRSMQDAAQAIALGDLKQRVRLPRGDDEVGRVAKSLNEMVDQVERAYETQRALEQRVRRFISDTSHELRTPLTSLRGFTDVLMRGAKDDADTLQRSLRLMKNETERMSRLINDLLTLARFDEGWPLQVQRVNVLDMATEAVEEARILARDGRDVSLHLTGQEEQWEVLADVDRLQQVLLILFDNAIKYGRPGPDGLIWLALEKEDGYILLYVIDNGQGIVPEDLPHLFEYFYRGQRAPTYADGAPIAGAGLGLSIALAIVRAHRGDMAVYSEAGKGTTVAVTLPCAS